MGTKKDNVFIEEENRLAEEEKKISKEYKYYIDKANGIDADIERMGVVTSADIADKKLLIDEREYNRSKAEEYLEYRDSPYFARLVLNAQTDGEEKSERVDYLIGDRLITVSDGGPIVLDWRSPMGQTYYQKNLLNFTLKECRYELLIRRALNIKDASLKGYNTEYISKKEKKPDFKEPHKGRKEQTPDVSQETSDKEKDDESGVIVDPFLLSILEDKRREKNATDIISTIQTKQIEIITKNVNQNFIVQGCAGSGKTMILLHRLSFLGFRKLIKPHNTRIITPSKFFNEFIDDLSRHLELDRIARCNIREYYIELIRSYSKGISIDTNTRSENNFPEKLLKDIYSEPFIHKLRNKYEEYWRNVLVQLEFERFDETLEKYLDERYLTIRYVEGITEQSRTADVPSRPNPQEYSYRTVSLIIRRLERVLQAAEQHKRIKEVYEKRAKQQQHIVLQYRISEDEVRTKAAEQRLKEQQEVIREETALIPLEIDKLRSARYYINQLSIEEIAEQVVEETLAEVYETHGVILTEKNYQHKLFVMLAVCNFYFGRSRIGDRFLNIDEAQDLSCVEYSLLRSVLGPECVFNLYGDISQNIYPYKGNRTWSRISKALGGEIYNLEQNYRNTMQITEFCNDQFSTDMLPIGISGKQVLSVDIRQGLKKLQSLRSYNKGIRAVIIKLQGSKKYDDIIMEMISKEDLSVYTLDDDKLSVITVEQAKGLEFGAVLVITDGMTTNEKYVSFTRALDNLIVVD